MRYARIDDQKRAPVANGERTTCRDCGDVLAETMIYEMERRGEFRRRFNLTSRYLVWNPTDNATVESFNGRLRQECLNENWFMSLEDAQCKIEAWRIHYNQRGSHSALGWMTPSEFAEKSAGCQNMQPT